jgi:hypothetical protein
MVMKEFDCLSRSDTTSLEWERVCYLLWICCRAPQYRLDHGILFMAGWWEATIRKRRWVKEAIEDTDWCDRGRWTYYFKT